VLPVGGIREKSLAARRQGIKTVVLPQGNMQDIVDLPEEVRKDLKFVPATTLEDVLKVALPDVMIGSPLVEAGSAGSVSAAAAKGASDSHG